MELVSVLERAAAVDLLHADRAQVVQVLRDNARLRAWLDSRDAACARRLEQLDDVTFPDVVIADASRSSTRDAQRCIKRASTLTLIPRFDKALEAGEVNAAHVDAMTNGLSDVPAPRRDGFVAEQDRLLDAARRSTPEAFTRAVRATVKRLLTTEDATDRLRRQRKATRLSVWVNAVGMICLRGAFDPETGAELLARLESAKQQLFPDHKDLPDSCPADPGERDDHLRALTLLELLLRQRAPGWRPETLLVIDDETLRHGRHGASIVDAGVDVDLPDEALQRLAARGRTVKVTMRRGVVTSVDGRTNLNLGRRSRLASFDQRRALRAMYPCCAIPDCPVRFRHTRIHHVRAWEDGGPTDIDNLVPLCTRHHHLVHDHGWILQLDPARNLTVTRPDGISLTSPPPYAIAC